MSEENYPCPSCKCDYAYPLDNMWVCPECAFEWDPNSEEYAAASDEIIEKDKQWRAIKVEADELRKQKNVLSKEINLVNKFNFKSVCILIIIFRRSYG